MSDPQMIKEIMEAVSIPVSTRSTNFARRDVLSLYCFSSFQVMAKSRIGHIIEAEILQAIGVDYIDE